MTDQEWMQLHEAVMTRYLAEGYKRDKAKKLTTEYLRNVRLDLARKSLEKLDR